MAPEGATTEKKDVLLHHEVLAHLDGSNPNRGVEVVGHHRPSNMVGAAVLERLNYIVHTLSTFGHIYSVQSTLRR
ncbi:uncharacterized protein PG986_000399 [Apiospora aurea]|uniref:Uncharacterized protein n=1 Tax=Apiospora aurea TaxID=335848 RepID=A0ABR1QUD6_9PEZI